MPRHRTTLVVACLLSLLGLAAITFAGPAASDLAFLEEPVSGEVDVRADLDTGAQWASDALIKVVFCWKDEANHLFLQANGQEAELGMVRDGDSEILAKTDRWATAAAGGRHQLIIKRRDWAIRVLCDGHVILTAYEEFAPGEQIGHLARGLKVTDLSTQPIGEMMFHDDFSRPPGEPDPWDIAEGSWAIRLPESRNAVSDPVKTANPFTLMATGQRALIAAGSSFWDGYQVRCSAKPGATGRIGVAFDLQSEKDYYVFRVSVFSPPQTASSGTVELVKVIDGNATVIEKAPGGVEVGKWVQLGIRSDDGLLSGLVDGKVVCSTRDNTFGEGQIGLYTEACAKANFDDVYLEPYRAYEDSYASDGLFPVEQRAGTWTLDQEQLCARPEAQSGLAVGLTGCSAWQNYRFSTDLMPTNARALGVYFGCLSPTDYYLFRWGPTKDSPDQDCQELWRVEKGKATVLASVPVPLDRSAGHHVEATLDRSYVCVAVDGKRALEAADPSRPSQGKVGYYAEGSRTSLAAFDNLKVEFTEPEPEPVSITEQFAKEDTMADWARPIASWKPLGSRVYQYDLPLWGDFNLRLPLGNLVGSTGSCQVRLAKDSDVLAASEDSRCVELSCEQGDRHLQYEAFESGKAVNSGKLALETEEPIVEVERRGGCVIASVEGKPFVWSRVPDGKTASALAIKLEGVGITLDESTVVSPQVLDYGFAGAPTEWQAQDGMWDVSDRWNCQPGWSWFCGRDAETPLIWTKQSFSGDVVYEYWVAMMMDLQAGEGGYSHPSDLNGILCGDGKNLCSGYAFVYAGDGNTRGKILRQGQTVAESSALRFLVTNTRGDLNAFHRHWWHMRVEKIGGHITYYVDGQKALEFDDPNPLSGGHLGLWSHAKNGIMVARVRIAYK